MTHGHAHEEAEHASHHASDPFDKRVAMSMVIIAAVLAAVKVVGHRAHNEVLQYQVKAGIAHTQESDQWNFFQAKKMRQTLAELRANLVLPEVSSGKTDKEWRKNIEKKLQVTKDNLNSEPPLLAVGSIEDQANKAIGAARRDRDKVKKQLTRVTPEQLERYYEALLEAQRYKAESDLILNNASKKHSEAQKYRKLSDHKHHQADWFDLGELGVELALVLSSVAILTKRAMFWYGGIGIGLLGLVAVAVGFFVH